MRILVTGATGFVGRRLAGHLVSRGTTVFALGRRPCELAGVENIRLTSMEPDAIAETLRPHPFDALIHLAAAGVNPGDRDDVTLMKVNAMLPSAMISAAASLGAKAVVIAGSSAEYKASPGRTALTEHAELETARLYGASKAAGSILALAQGAARNIPVAVLRLFNVYGPGEAPHRLLPSMLDSFLGARPVKLSAGTQVRDFVYVDDACAGMTAALDGLIDGRLASGAYNLATGIENSVADFARTAARLAGVGQELLQFGALPMRPDDLPHVVGDPTLLRNACGWSSRVTLEQGIAAAIKEYENNRCAIQTPST